MWHFTETQRERGVEPLPMMDRQRSGDIPHQQVGFLEAIVVPSLVLLNAILQSTMLDALETARQSLTIWRAFEAGTDECDWRTADMPTIRRCMPHLFPSHEPSERASIERDKPAESASAIMSANGAEEELVLLTKSP